jgi:hypothetical protein
MSIRIAENARNLLVRREEMQTEIQLKRISYKRREYGVCKKELIKKQLLHQEQLDKAISLKKASIIDNTDFGKERKLKSLVLLKALEKTEKERQLIRKIVNK